MWYFLICLRNTGSLGLLWGNGGKRWVWGSHTGKILGDKQGGKIRWGNEKENGKRSKHSKEVCALYNVSFLVNFSSAGVQGWWQSSAGGGLPVAEGHGMVWLCFCLCSFAFFSIEPVLLKLCIRIKEISINLCGVFFAFGAHSTRVLTETSLSHVGYFIPWEEKWHNWTSQSIWQSLQDDPPQPEEPYFLLSICSQTLDMSEDANELEAQSWCINSGHSEGKSPRGRYQLLGFTWSSVLSKHSNKTARCFSATG